MTLLDEQWIRALSHPTRVAVPRHLLMDGDASPTVVAAALGKPLSNVSHHFRVLREAQRIRIVRRVQKRGAIEHRYSLTSRTATMDVLRRFAAPATQGSGPDLQVAEPWATVQRAVAELRRRRQAQEIGVDELGRRLRIKPSLLASKLGERLVARGVR